MWPDFPANMQVITYHIYIWVEDSEAYEFDELKSFLIAVSVVFL